MGEGKCGMIWENSIETCILSSVKQIASPGWMHDYLMLVAGALGWPRGMGWGGRWEGVSGWGTHVNPWLIHVNVWQKPLQYCKVISLQLIKINGKKKGSVSKYSHILRHWGGGLWRVILQPTLSPVSKTMKSSQICSCVVDEMPCVSPVHPMSHSDAPLIAFRPHVTFWRSFDSVQAPPPVWRPSALKPVFPSGDCQWRRYKRHEFKPWVRKIPWRRKWQPTPVFLPGESHGLRSPASYTLQGHRVRHDWVT